MELDEFAKKMRQYGANVEQNANLLKRKVALAVDQTVVLATPVDTGRARSNWQASLDTPITSTREPYAPGEKGSTGGANSQSAIDQAREVVGRTVPEQAVHITNNLAYIGRLNDGWSAQAPAGFIEKAVINGVNVVRSAPGIVTGKITIDGL